MTLSQDLNDVAEPLEDRPVPQAIPVVDQRGRVVFIEVCGKDLGTVTDATSEAWRIEDVDDGSGRVGDPQFHLSSPFRSHAPFRGGH